MALHIKSTKSFKILLGFSALLISGMAATFSITGIATLFSGYFLTVAMMMGALEFAKIVVASFLARYWSTVSRILRTYFIAALMVLILITSGGIFGYLSDAYQRTKGDYSIIEKQTEILKNKKNRFDTNIKYYQDEKANLDKNINTLIEGLNGNVIKYTDKNGNQVVTSSSAARKIYQDQLTENQKRRDILTQKIDADTDSSTSIDSKIFEFESKNIQGELGPLKYIATIFNTSMDNVVKYFIFLLIFVFDPLAVLLFVSLNTLIRKDTLEEEMDVNIVEKNKKPEVPDIENKLKVEPTIEPIVEPEIKANDLSITTEGVEQKKQVQEIEPKKKASDAESEKFVKELINELEKSMEIKEFENKNDEHEFYHEEIKEEIKKDDITFKSSNYHP
jgi:hypothetical protein